MDAKDILLLLLMMQIALTKCTLVTENLELQNSSDSVTVAPESKEDKMKRYRLPNIAIPRMYLINIEPKMDDEIFTWIGKSAIKLSVYEFTNSIILHAYKNLYIYEYYTLLSNAAGETYKPSRHSRDDEVEFLKIEFDMGIPAGNYSLRLGYKGEEIGDGHGFYRISYTSQQGPKNIAMSFFEPTNARRAFPCWDEPGIKAHFRIHITHNPKYMAISNMPEIRSAQRTDGKVCTTFAETPLMSTYLVNIGIGDYANITNKHGNITVWAREDAMNEAQYYFDNFPKAIRIMESYTGLSFGVRRIGLVMLPIIDEEALENWGLVNCPEIAEKFDRITEISSKHRDRIDIKIAHEAAHAWFGNRVSPVWWSDTWLNEGFATYFQYFLQDKMHDNWNALERFVVKENQENTFPKDEDELYPSVKWMPITNTEISDIFNDITYSKGAAIVHMIRNILTDDIFQAGVQKFLTKHSFGVAETKDLMRAFQEAYDEKSNPKVPLNVEEVMMSWLTQTGYPTIMVSRNYITGDTIVSQGCLIGNNSDKRWWIPLSYATKTNLNFASTVPSHWLSNEEDSLTIRGIDKDDWVIFNVRANGYFRVDYDHENWKRIIEYLNTENYNNIDVLNRAQIIDDSLYLLKRNFTLYNGNAWQLTKYLRREVEYPAWNAAKRMLEHLRKYLIASEVYETFQNYVFDLMKKLIHKFGFEIHENDDSTTKLLKNEIIGWACQLGHPKCVKFSARRFLRFIKNPHKHRLHIDSKAPIFCAGLRGLSETGTQRVYNWALENDKSLLVESIGCTDNHDIHRKFLRRQTENCEDLINSIAHMLELREENYDFGVEYFIENLATINNCTDGAFSIFWSISDFTTTETRLQKFKKILKMKSIVSDENFSNEQLEEQQQTVTNNDNIVTNFRRWWNETMSYEKEFGNV